ncbi:UDP-N-acetylmuramoyl-L-alanine--D-glutamate ligase [Natroniella sulfidigena]|uniref:UDP-N-acetylmuramoyl-L-alanine--D-glutamate ligase n=1 Tax=Natroniella sulfidigena TaxID=723921 RepID=UPI00200B1624|nr:UDP-N-acetylmuramoyl-L-alanine--D-glutamate ligase [Natroniella sulfidigena]MCK8817333.1 UDP-N-acetylmuramoyl-L-alanine--D-glutamate ligase [Natroniella sulfidigena]
MKLKDKLVTVVGLGKRTGVEVVKFLDQKGAKIIVTDTKTKAELMIELSRLEDYQFKLDLGGHTEELILKSDLIVISPGVPYDIPILKQARDKGIKIMSEIELAYSFSTTSLVAITGTNGKTTTTTLLGEICSKLDRQVAVGGNIGRPLIKDLPDLKRDDLAIAEISSFQLEEITDFKPDIGLILNITPDHLDRHGTFEEYIKAKRRLLSNQTEQDYAVLNYDDQLVREFADYTAAETLFFSQKTELDRGVYIKNGEIIANLTGQPEKIIATDEIRIKGPHNLENTLGAVTTSLLLGIRKEIIVETLHQFGGVDHRIESVGVVNGVEYINDSKGTNPVAATKAVETFKQPLILIAGGKDKGSDFSKFAEVIVDQVKELILLGETAPQIEQAVKKLGYQATNNVDSIEEAVDLADKLAVKGDVVLLSPACASWDMYNNYKERGEEFRGTVKKLRRE